MRSKDIHKQEKWDREEVVLLVAEYFRTKNMIRSEIEDCQKRISDTLRRRKTKLVGSSISPTYRNMNGIVLQMSRIKCIDPETEYSGMQGTALQKQIVQEYIENPEKIKAEAYEVFMKYSGK